jgi:hypothetical protein
MKVPITHDLRLLASVWGGFRTFVSRSGNVKDAKVGPQSGADADIDGILGELAFCQAFNVWPDLGLHSRSGSYDCLVKGKRIDIKTTRRADGRLLCRLKDNPDVDIYVLALLTDNAVTFAGWAYKHELCRPENIRNLGGYNDGYALDQSQLRKIQIDRLS